MEFCEMRKMTNEENHCPFVFYDKSCYDFAVDQWEGQVVCQPGSSPAQPQAAAMTDTC